jgi:hypothetical protein
MFPRDGDRTLQPERAEEHLRQQLSFARDTGATDPSSLNFIAAKNILHEDLGRFDTILHWYRLDDDARDRLIAHTRQDAAHALLNTATLLDQVRALRRGLWLIGVLVFALVIAVLTLGWVLVAKN